MTIKRYRFKKIMTDFVIFNIVINGLFYIINFRNHSGIVTFDVIRKDLLIGLVILAFLCPAAGFINLPKAFSKDKIDFPNRKQSYWSTLFPKKNWLRSLLLTAFTLLFSSIFFIYLPMKIGVGVINHPIGFSIKVMTAVLMSAIIGYVVVELLLDDYQMKQQIEKNN